MIINRRKKRILVFNSGSGSGFQELVENSRTGILNADIVGLVSNKEDYPCIDRAMKLGIIVALPMKSFRAEDYQALVKFFKADYVALSGWLKMVRGLDPRITFKGLGYFRYQN